MSANVVINLAKRSLPPVHFAETILEVCRCEMQQPNTVVQILLKIVMHAFLFYTSIHPSYSIYIYIIYIYLSGIPNYPETRLNDCVLYGGMAPLLR